MAMNRWLIATVVALVVVLGFGYCWGSKGYRDADVAKGRVEVLEAQREALELVARRDSAALDSTQIVTAIMEGELEAARIRARQGAARASEDATEARGEVRAILDSLGASHEALDRLEAAHTAEIVAITTERDLADSTTAVVRGLLAATEAALASERATNQAFERENDALRDQIQALNRGKWKDRAMKGGLVAAVIAVAILR